MHTIKTIEGDFTGGKGNFALVVGRWNSFVVEHLLDGAVDAPDGHDLIALLQVLDHLLVLLLAVLLGLVDEEVEDEPDEEEGQQQPEQTARAVAGLGHEKHGGAREKRHRHEAKEPRFGEPSDGCGESSRTIRR